MVLSTILGSQGKDSEALAEANAEPAEWARLTSLGFVHSVAGRTAEYQEALRKLEETHANDAAYQIAALRAVGGDRDGAFTWLDRAYQDRDAGLSQVKHEPSFRPLHGDPRWGTLLKKIGLEA
jgi:hypothetical protein